MKHSVPPISFTIDGETGAYQERIIWSSPPDHWAEEVKLQLTSKSQK